MKVLHCVFHSIVIFVLLFHTACFAENTAQDTAAECFKRAEKNYKEARKYANDVRDPSKWFDLAMKDYLCAAKAGNPKAMLRVVELSRSFTEPLPKEEEDMWLLRAAEANLADAQIGLAYDYCDNYGRRPSCKNPVEAHRWLLRAAKNGSAWGAFQLGYLYESEPDSGNLKSFPKALACYRLSLQRYQAELQIAHKREKPKLASEMEWVERGIRRIEGKFATDGKQVGCFE